VACGLCGTAAQAAGLCPSFYRAQRTANASAWKRYGRRLNDALMGLMGAS
jgi:indolepyruvate ferredoxin oxidoreductase alpha subunit